jgi:predicted RNA binding protein YcfA (HicA-like mRNA interferase family)
MTGKAMLRELRKHGWEVVRIEGSHHVLEKDGKTVTVPVHGNKDLKKGTEYRIGKETGLRQ